MKSALSTFAAVPLFLLGMVATGTASGQAPPAKEVRIQKADILKHPAGQAALRYAGARKSSAEFRKKVIPNRADLAAGIEAGGILIIEGGQWKVAT